MKKDERASFGPRIKEVRLAKKMTLKEFYGPATKYVNNFSPIENGKRIIGERLLADILRIHKISMNWLVNQEGSMFVEEPTVAEEYKGVPFFNVNFSDITFSEFNLLRETPEYYVNLKPLNDCDAFLTVYGDSMYPKYASGEIIAVREVTNMEVIQWGEAYLIITDETANNMITVKSVFEHYNESSLVLRAFNPAYTGDTIIERSAIKRLFIIKGKVMRNQL
ncbi:XRE family transcriptional regulator [Pedobacter sp. AW31-3R]|uniref:XRE family transcriptional regulator n=1 Tax=Pedobacter sp. AW31-3R TaxID=3445781 RepID=UPI003FA15F9E